LPFSVLFYSLRVFNYLEKINRFNVILLHPDTAKQAEKELIEQQWKQSVMLGGVQFN
jgi:hypothetical protein